MIGTENSSPTSNFTNFETSKFQVLATRASIKLKAKIMVQSTGEPQITKISKFFHFRSYTLVFECLSMFVATFLTNLRQKSVHFENQFYEIECGIHQLSSYFSPKSKDGIKSQITN